MHNEHFAYLKEISSLCPNTYIPAAQLWLILWEQNMNLPLPSACTGPDGQIMYSWDKNEHHFEVEILPNKPMEFFYKNRLTGELWGEVYILSEPLSNEVLEKLNLLI